MDDIGIFREMEIDGKLFQVYHHPKYHPITQTQSSTSSGEAASHDHPFQPPFLCPILRISKEESDLKSFPITSSSVVTTEQGETTEHEEDHSILPLFWCNNKEFQYEGGSCYVCDSSNFGTDFFLCVCHDRIFHKECVQSPTKIKHPYHPQHSLQLSVYCGQDRSYICLYCGREAFGLVYKGTQSDVAMHPTCAMKSVLIIEDQPKTHDHPLTLFPKQACLTCNVCGLLGRSNQTYVCLRCSFVAHDDCMYFPRIIKMSRHHHRISYISSHVSGDWSCGVCRESIDNDYGSYTCDKCGDYAVHSRCALREDMWDGVELEGVPEKDEDDITQDDGPFKTISEGVILHFLHDHHLRFEVSVSYDENKVCQACVLPIYEGNFYSCVECDFIIHETCTKSPRIIEHALHPHPLTLNAIHTDGFYECNACSRGPCCGFVYACTRKECNFDLDVRCASVSEPFDYQGHSNHPLFLPFGPNEKPLCRVCKSKSHISLNCMKCDFIVCITCATLPYEVRYKYDKHLLKIVCGKEVCEEDWCDVCECMLGDTNTKMFYWCKECSTTVHIECLLGEEPYLKPGINLPIFETNVQVLCKSPVSTPLCDNCKTPCHGKIYNNGNLIACSFRCGLKIF